MAPAAAVITVVRQVRSAVQAPSIVVPQARLVPPGIIAVLTAADTHAVVVQGLQYAIVLMLTQRPAYACRVVAKMNHTV